MDSPKKRNEYRVPILASEKLTATLVFSDDRSVEAKVLDTSASGLGIAVEDDDAAAMEQGAELEARISSHDKPLGVIMACRIVSAMPEGTRTRYGVAFVRPADLNAQLDSKWWRYFNRRNSFRIRPEPFDLNLLGNGMNAVARPHDFAADGIGVDIDAEVGQALSEQGQIRIAFELPGSDKRFSFKGLVIHRTVTDGRMLLGLRIDAEHSLDYERGCKAIEEFTINSRKTV